MSEQRESYTAYSLLKPQGNGAIMDTELDTVRAELEELERRLIPLLVTIQRALGKEPARLTRRNTYPERNGR